MTDVSHSQDLYIFFANSPGFILSVWLNLIATKLKFENHQKSEIRKSFTNYLAKESSRRQSIQLLVGDDGELTHNHESENPLQPAIDFGKIVWDVTSQTSPAPTSHENLVVGIVAIWLAVVSTISIAHFSNKTNQFIVGLIVNLNLVFFYGAPLSTIWKVLASHNSVSIHIPTMAANTANGSFWTAYGIAVGDPFIYVPNAMGAGLGVIQIILIILFPRKVDHSDTKCASPNDVAVAKGSNDAMAETESDQTPPTLLPVEREGGVPNGAGN
jgi:solute carrier family 50 protein (sugar transporter)